MSSSVPSEKQKAVMGLSRFVLMKLESPTAEEGWSQFGYETKELWTEFFQKGIVKITMDLNA